MSTPLRNREYQVFVSYSHEDSNAYFATALTQWIREAGVEVWLDQNSLRARGLEKELPSAIGNCRGFLLLASHSSLTSDWVKKEIKCALAETEKNASFEITILRLDDVPLSEVYPALADQNWIDCSPRLPLDSDLLVKVVNGIFSRPPTPPTFFGASVFVSRSDREREVKAGNELCRRFIELTGHRLVGDPIDLGENELSTTEERLNRLLSMSSGHLMVLPARAEEKDYRYFLNEFRRSRDLNLPLLILAASSSGLPAELSGHDNCLELSGETDPQLIEERMESFGDDVRNHRPAVTPRIFFAFEYKKNADRNRFAFDLLSSCTGLPCQTGKDFDGVGQARIIDAIEGSAIMIADLASATIPGTGALDLNINTCVEAGVALGCGFGRVDPVTDAYRPIDCLCFDAVESGQGKEKTRLLPFMLRDLVNIQWYNTDLDFLATVHAVARKYAIRILNHELRI